MKEFETFAPFIIAALFLLAIIAPLVWILRGLGWWRAPLLAVLAVGVFIASFFLQNALMDVPGYAEFVATLARIGRVILIVAVIVLLTDLAAMVVYTIRHGKRDDWKSNVDTANRGAFFQGPGSQLLMKRSKIRTLYNAGGYVQVKSLVDGTATTGERMIFIGIFTALTAFCFVFVGLSLMLVGRLLFAAVLPIAAGHVLFGNVRIAVHQYKAAKETLAARHRGG
jgi:hypothetical protein